MKILLISFRSDVGGGPQLVLDLANGILKHASEHSVYIAAPNSRPFGPQFESIAMQYFALPDGRFSLIALFRLYLFVRANEINIVHSHGRGAGYYSRLLKFINIKTIHSFHGVHLPPGIKGKIKIRLDQLLSNLTDGFICTSTEEERLSIEKKINSPTKSFLIFNGFDIETHNAKVKGFDRYVYRNKIGISENSVIIGSLARFDYQKGLDLMVESVRANAAVIRKANIKILIAGAGSEFKNIKIKIKNDGVEDLICLLGLINNPEEFVTSCDGYFSFSRWEGMPLSVLLALALKTPCIVSECPGHTDLIGHRQTGLIFDNKNPDEFKKCLNFLLQNKYAVQKMVEKGYTNILENHNTKNWVKKIIAVYSDTIYS